MSYQPLALKYRPARFQDMLGQDSVAKALANAIMLGREPRAILFTGVRGVGKTTVARLYAKALNCSSRLEEAEPCNTCESCLAIMAGRHEDVLEIDGASNTGVNDVRALQETVEYVPQRSRFKVYIIDEVHMLSTAAFNALLKTLEEPPRHVVFVFATTELEKVPATILSRCQAFYLKKLPISLIRDRLTYILSSEGIEFEDKALTVIAREGHGSMRDALTLLDQAIALGQGTVTVAGLGPVVSRLSSSPYLDLLDAMVQRDAGLAMATIEQLDQNGAEFASVVEDVAQLARHGFVIKGLGRNALEIGLLGLDDAEVERLFQIADKAAPFDLNRIFRTMAKARTDLDGSGLDRFVMENYVFEWCFDPGLPDVESLLKGGSGFGGPSGKSGSKESGAEPQKRDAQKREPLTVRFAAQNASAKVVALPPSSPNQQEQKQQNDYLAKAPTGSDVAPSTAPEVAAPHSLARESSQSPQPLSQPASMPEKLQFPSSWRELLDAWREKKPLSARKLEEAHPISYAENRIVLGISDKSYVSKALLQKDEQLKIRDQFQELFGFAGVLVIEPLAGEASSAQLPKNVLTERVEEAVDKRRSLIETARNAPFTQDLVAVLGASIEDISIVDT
jgi:DNA polymerase-3 subunit gamma/tau